MRFISTSLTTLNLTNCRQTPREDAHQNACAAITQAHISVIENTQNDGYEFRAPIGCYDPNDYGLYDMIGNVGEWTTTEYVQTRTPNGYTVKGGSFLYAPNYCARYLAPARQRQEANFSTNHIGFRTVSKAFPSN